MDKGGEASAMAHNIPIVTKRGGREMVEEIELGDHKGDNNMMALVAMTSAEKVGGSNGGHHHRLCSTKAGVNGGIGNGSHCFRRRRAPSTAAMAVFINSNGEGGRGRGRTRAQG